jgi:hypothetical protein
LSLKKLNLELKNPGTRMRMVQRRGELNGY